MDWVTPTNRVLRRLTGFELRPTAPAFPTASPTSTKTARTDEARHGRSAASRKRRHAPNANRSTLPPPRLAAGSAEASMFFERYPRFGRRMLMNLRHEAIIRQHSDAFHGARVLDIASSEGAWSFAALEAGAVHVIGIESREDKVLNAREHFAEYGVDTNRYQFVAGDVFDVLAHTRFEVDVVLCLGFLYHTLRYPELMHHIRSTGAETLIIDTEVAIADDPLVRLVAENADVDGNASQDAYSVANTVLSGRPSLAAIEKLLNVYGFAVDRRSDWAAILRDNPAVPGTKVYAEARRVTVLCRRSSGIVWQEGGSRF